MATKVIGLVGGIASGKTTVASVLEGLGAHIINADKLGHEAYRPGEPCYEKLIAEFGAGILNDDRERTIDRKKLGAKVFGPNNKSRMATLTGIVWPEIRVKIEQQVAAVRNGDHGQPPPLCIVITVVHVKQQHAHTCLELTDAPPESSIVLLQRLHAPLHLHRQSQSTVADSLSPARDLRSMNTTHTTH